MPTAHHLPEVDPAKVAFLDRLMAESVPAAAALVRDKARQHDAAWLTAALASSFLGAAPDDTRAQRCTAIAALVDGARTMRQINDDGATEWRCRLDDPALRAILERWIERVLAPGALCPREADQVLFGCAAALGEVGLMELMHARCGVRDASFAPDGVMGMGYMIDAEYGLTTINAAALAIAGNHGDALRWLAAHGWRGSAPSCALATARLWGPAPLITYTLELAQAPRMLGIVTDCLRQEDGTLPAPVLAAIAAHTCACVRNDDVQGPQLVDAVLAAGLADADSVRARYIEVALRHACPPLVRHLLGHIDGARVIDTTTGRTWLHALVDDDDSAPLPNRAEVLELLLGAGAPPDPPDADGNTPLHLATRHHSAPLIGILASAGADLGTRNKMGHTALDEAISHQNLEATQALQALLAQRGIERVLQGRAPHAPAQ